MGQDPNRELKVLVLEDVATDAELVEHALRKGGFRFVARRAEGRASFEAALKAFEPDLVLSDYNLPDLNGIEALKIARAFNPDLPVIAVTGALGDEAAADLVRTGARDYVLKDRLARLPIAVERVLQEAEELRARRRAEAALARQAAILSAVQETSPDAVLVVDSADRVILRNQRFSEIFQIPDSLFETGADSPLLEYVSGKASEPEAFRARVREIYADPQAASQDEVVLADRRILDRYSAPVRLGASELGRVWFFRDITDRKRAEQQIRDEEARFRGLVEQEIAGIYVIGSDGRMNYINAWFAGAMGYRLEDVIGHPFTEFVAERDVDLVRRSVVGRVRGDQPTAQYTAALKRRDGSLIEVLIHSARTVYQGEPCVTGVLIDVTEQKQAEERLRASEEQFRQLMEWAPEAILLFDVTRNRFVAANRNAEVLFGCSRDELLKSGPQTFYSAVQPDERPVGDSFAEHNQAALEGGEVVFERHIHNALGQDLICEIRLVRFESAARPMIRASMIDITERKRAEQKIREDEARFRALVEQELTGIFILSSDQRLNFINPGFARALGYRPEEMIGHPVLDFIDEDSRPAAVERFRRVMAGDRAIEAGEISLKRRGGGLMVALTHSSHAVLEGEPVAVGVILDITERKRAEQKILEDEARFRGVVEQELAGIYILRPDGTIAYINPGFARMLGYSAQEVVGRPFIDFIPEAERGVLQRRFAAEMGGEPQPPQIGAAIVRKDGSIVDVLAQSRMASYEGKPASIGIILDISEQKKAELDLRRVNRTLLTLSEGNEALVRAESEQELLQAMCRIVVERGGYRMAWIGVPQDDESRAITPVASAGDVGDYLASAAVSWSEKDVRGRGVMGAAVRTGQRQTSQNFAADRRTQPWQAEAEKRGFASSAAFPLKDGDKVFAVLALYSGELDAFNEEELKLLQELANDIAYGVKALRVRAEREAAIQRWRASLVSTISAIASTTEMRDPYTAGHQHRVAKLAVEIARELRLPEDQVQGVYLAGIIHDVGKITVPSELLTKPGKLSPLEYQLIQTHAQAGYEVVKGVDFPWPIADAIRQHHERIDGSGYPQGLHGNEIIPEAKILAVADTVEAMMSHRPYRPALGLEAALEAIEKEKGRLYDPAAVDACLRLFREKGFSLS